jgi:activating signal cointegrator 1
MKAITLSQPWATLVAIGAKRIETRGWSTKYRGPLAIHAAKGLGGLGMEPSGFGLEFDLDLLCREPKFVDCLLNAGYTRTSMLPRGQVVAICDLVSVREILPAPSKRELPGWEWAGPDGTNYRFELDDREYAFGDYTAGRHAWLLHNVRQITPVPAKGALGLWECHQSLEKVP